MYKHNIISAKVFLFLFAFLNIGCEKTNSIQCLNVNNQSVCFTRQIKGRETESLTLSTNNDVCHRASTEDDYTVSALTYFGDVDYKIENNKMYVYAAPLDKPRNKFPVEVILIPYDPLKSEQELKAEGFQKLNLGNDQMTWCF